MPRAPTRPPSSTTSARSATASWPSACGAWPPACVALGLRREERVLLLMQDGNDWPVGFLGAMYAGVVPVAVNTLLTADDYAYMLEHSPRAGGAGVRRAAAGAAGGDGASRDHEVRKVDRLAPGRAAARRRGRVRAPSSRRTPPLAKPARHRAPTTPASGSIPRAPPAGPRARCTRTPTPTGRPSCTARACWACARRDVVLLGRQAVLRLRPGQRADLPAERRRHHAADGRAADAGRHLQALARRRRRRQADGLLRRAHRLRRHAGLARPAGARARWRCAWCSSAGEALPREIGERFKRHFGVDIVDGIGSTEMLHIFLSNRPGEVRYGTTGWPVPGYEIELRGDDGRAGARRRARRPLHPGPVARR